MCFLAIDVDFLKKRKGGIEVIFDKLLDFLFASGFLSEELVAGETQNNESLILELTIHLRHLFVVDRSQPSLACHIHHHDALHLSVNLEVHNIAVNVADLEIKEAIRNFGRQLLTS